MTEITSSADEIVVGAPAKVNLMIRVRDRLSNGYHEVWTLMHTVDLFDSVRIRINTRHEKIALVCGNSSLPVDGRNLVYRAAEMVFQQTGQSVGVDIGLNKEIFTAGGLGGGSSDAAATIFGLAQLLQLDWGIKELKEMGSRIGSDVPFFFQAPCAVVSGWGQDVQGIKMEGERWVVLVNPGFSISTKWAYEHLDSERTETAFLSEWSPPIHGTAAISWEDIIGGLQNDFEKPLFPQYPILEFIKEKLLILGAQAALLSGSGATVFGIFDSHESARHASDTLKQDTHWHVYDGPFGTTSLPHDSNSAVQAGV